MRVLLIEDDTGTAQSIELMLKVQDIYVYRTDLGEEGVDLGKIYDYDIILLDLNLPDMSGYEVLRSLRAAKVLLQSSYFLASRASKTRSGRSDLALMIIFPSLSTGTNLSPEFTPSSAAQKVTRNR